MHCCNWSQMMSMLIRRRTDWLVLGHDITAFIQGCNVQVQEAPPGHAASQNIMLSCRASHLSAERFPIARVSAALQTRCAAARSPYAPVQDVPHIRDMWPRCGMGFMLQTTPAPMS